MWCTGERANRGDGARHGGLEKRAIVEAEKGSVFDVEFRRK